MSVVKAPLSVASVQAEWLRVEALVSCLMRSRQGAAPGPELLAELGRLHDQVSVLRRDPNSPWWRLPLEGLPPLALDILACIYASQALPRIAWLFQDLQAGQAQPCATAALIHMLLALDEAEVKQMQALLDGAGELQRRNLIEVEGDGPTAALRPARTALAMLLGWQISQPPPPGSVLVKHAADWADLVLPPDRERMIREFLLWLRHRDRVVDEWGGRPVGGPVALFSGPSGTGKTFAASVIAGELGWPLYRVDLARLVSKYIGETEKNLGRLFDAAHGRELVLQFDEVDSLMSKRGEVKEARDRYANMEVSYLLARIEDHRGPCILTTNLRSQIDKAFSRRFQMVIEFPRPDEAARAELWRRMLPRRAPLCPSLDLDFLAASVNLTGGNIRNASLHAAYLAAEADEAINMGHIATAVWRELAKERPQLSKGDLGALASHLPVAVLA